MLASRIVILDEIRAKPILEIEQDRFRSDLRRFSLDVYRGTGENLAISLLGLKNSNNITERETYLKIKESFRDITGLDFDLSYEPSDKEKKKEKLNIWILARGQQIPIDYIGCGILEILNILRTTMGNEECIIMLDEPALHLHPLTQSKLLQRVIEEVEGRNNQVILITHSPYILNSNYLKNTIRFALEDNETKIYPLDKWLGRIKPNEKEKIEKYLEMVPESKAILFSRGVILAEGFAEKLVLEFS